MKHKIYLFIALFCGLSGKIICQPTISTSPDSIHDNTFSCNDSIVRSIKLYNNGISDLFVNLARTSEVGRFILSDGFESGNLNSWNDEGGNYNLEVPSTGQASGNYSFRLTGGNGSYYDGISRSFPASTPDYIGFKIKSPSGSGSYNCDMAFGDNNIQVNGGLCDFWVDNSLKEITIWTPNSGTLTAPMSNDQWHQVEFKNIDYINKTFDFVVDDSLIQEDVVIWDQTLTYLNIIHLFGYSANTTSYWDDIVIGYTDWISLDLMADTITAGDSSTVKIGLNTNGLFAKRYQGGIEIASNDPVDSIITIPVVFDVTGNPQMTLSDTCLYYDTVQQYGINTLNLIIYNPGCDTLHVTGLTTGTTEFSVDTNMLAVAPFDSSLITVSFSSNTSGTFSDNLSVTSDAGNASVCLNAEVESAPLLAVDPASINASIANCGDSLTKQLVIKNNGTGNLDYQLLVVSGGGASGSNENIYFEGFESGSLSGWVDEGGSQTEQLVTNDPASGKYALRIDGYGAQLSGISHTFNNSTPDYISFKMKSGNTSVWGNYIVIGDNPGSWSSGIIYLIMRGGGNGIWLNNRDVISYNQDQWYHFELKNINWSTKRYDFYVDGNLVVANEPFRNTAVNQINEVHLYGGNNLAIAYYDDISIGPPPTVVALSNDSGAVAPSDSVIVDVTFYSEGLWADNYSLNINITSNDPVNPDLDIPATMDLTGAPSLALSTTCLDLDSIMELTTSTDTFFIVNNGCDSLKVSNITSTNAAFSANPATLDITPFDSAQVVVTFAPTTSGTFAGNLNIFTNDVDTSICLSGKAFNSPSIALSPTSIVETLSSCGDSIQKKVKVYNNGAGTLDYFLYTQSATPTPGQKIKVAVYYNTVIANILNKVPDIEATAISTYNASVLAEYDVLLNARYSNYDQAAVLDFISNGGSWVGELNSNAIPVNDWGVISGNAVATIKNNSTGSVIRDSSHYLAESIDWDNLPYGANPCQYMIDLRGIDDPEANIIATINHTQYPDNPLLVEKRYGQGKILLFNWDYRDDPDYNGYVEDMIQEVVRYAGISNTWLEADTTEGTIAPGDSTEITFTLNAQGQYAGSYKDTVVFNSNDPVNPKYYLPVDLTINGIPVLDISDTCLHLDSIVEFSSSTDSIVIYNTGCDTLKVTDISSSQPEFTADTSAINIFPFDSAKVRITFSPLAQGDYSANLNITTNAGDTAICLSGKAYDSPVAFANPDSLVATIIECGDSASVPLKIRNDGGTELIIEPSTSSLSTIFDDTDSLVFTQSGATSDFNFSPVPQGDSIFVTVTLRGDFDSGSEYAYLYMDGFYQGVIPDNNLPNGTDIVVNYAFGGSDVQNWLSDNSLVVRIRNRTSVGNFGNPLHKVRIQIADSWVATDIGNDTIQPGDSLEYTVKFYAGVLNAGEYDAVVNINTNDPINKELLLPAHMTIVGRPLIELSDTCITIDSTMELTSTTDTIIFANTGCDTLFISNVTNNLPEYSVDTTEFAILPNQSKSLYITFSPTSTGTYNDTLFITNNDVDTFICLSAYAYDKPQISIDPDSFKVTINTCRDSVTKQLKIYNTGTGDLSFNLVENFNNKIVKVAVFNNSNVTAALDKSPWIQATTVFDVNSAILADYDVLVNVTRNNNISQDDVLEFIRNGGGWVGELNGNNIPVNDWGVILGSAGTVINTSITGVNVLENEHYLATAIDWPNLPYGSNPLQYMIDLRGITDPNARVIVTANHTIWPNNPLIVEKKYGQGRIMLLNHDYRDDPDFNVQIEDLIQEVVRYAAKPQIWYTPDTLAGLISGVDSTIINLKFSAEDILSGTYRDTLIINSNDPLTPQVSVPLAFELQGYPVIALSDTCFAMDSVVETSQEFDTLKIFNTGCDTLKVTDIVSSDVNFTVDTTTFNAILPNDTGIVTITFTPPAPGNYSGTLTISSNDVDTVLCLSGVGIQKPEIALEKYFIIDTITGCEDTGIVEMNIYNYGGSNLEWLINAVTNSKDDFDPAVDDSFWSSYTGILGQNCGSVGGNAMYFENNGMRQATTIDLNTLNGGTLNFYIKLGNGGSCETVDDGEEVVLEYSTNGGSSWSQMGFYDNGMYPSFTLITEQIPAGAKTASTRFRWRQLGNSGTCCDHWALDNIVVNHISGTVTANPKSGITAPNDSSTVQIIFDASSLSPGTYFDTLIVTSNDPDSSEIALPWSFTQTVIPPAPVAQDTSSCFGEPTPDLIASGTEIRWYYTANLDSLAHAGATFSTGETAVGTYTYYVTQTEDSCESPSDTVNLVINDVPVQPSVRDTSICFGVTTPDLITPGSNIKWYDDAALTNLIHEGNTFSTGKTAVGSYTYYLNDSISGCPPGDADTVVLTIDSVPAKPSALDTSICSGDPTPDLYALGDSITWYSDVALTTPVNYGDTFATGKTASGTYTYYVTETDTLNGCASSADTSVLVIITTPAAPLISDENACDGDTVPDLIALTGDSIRWYDDVGLANLVHTGDTFATGKVAIGSYTYYATQTIPEGCVSSTTTVKLNIYAVPSAPTASDETICFGEMTPDLTSTGTNIKWYDDAALTNMVNSGSPFATGHTASGTYIYYVTQTVDGCESPTDTSLLSIYPLPNTPAVEDTTICFGQATPDLIFDGDSIRWYDDAGLSNMVHSGDTFATGETAVGTYTYYVTETGTLTGCESGADVVTLTINNIPAAPVADDTTICFGESTPDLVTTGVNIKWYDDAGLTNVIHQGDVFATGDTAVGTYTYYLTDSIDACPHGVSDTVVLTINPIPGVPDVSDTAVCVYNTIPDLIADGDSIRWYDDLALTNMVFNGDTFATGQTLAGSYTYYVTQTDPGNGCEGPDTVVTLTIDSTPPPLSADQEACFGFAVPDLTATGDSIKWYDDVALTNLVHSGDTFATGQSAVGDYAYYATETQNGCESEATYDTLTIHPIPAAPVSNDKTVCENDAVPNLTATGSNIKWYYNASLDSLAQNGSSFATGETAPGTYTYYVTQTENGCESPATTVTLTITPLPAQPATADVTTCETDATPDLTATGTAIQWYDDAALTNMVHAGSPFATGQTVAGSYAYYVTQTVSGCEGPSDTVTLAINSIPAKPVVDDSTVCADQAIPDLIYSGTNVQWYDDANLTNLVYSGTNFITGHTAVGSYTYYLTDSVEACAASMSDTATLTINAVPAAPEALDTAICLGETVPDLIAAGDSIRWYDDAALTNMVHSGDTFATGQTAAGTYTYYVTETVNGCVSPKDTSVLSIHFTPAPASSNEEVCFGSPTPDLTASGTNVQWYDDAALTNLLHSGDTFATGQTAVGSFVYYVTQTLNNCESDSTIDTLTIHPIPSAPTSSDVTVCEGDAVPDLTATGTNIQWYDDAALTNLVNTGSPFATGKTAPGTYTYYVTQTENGCESPSTTVALTINALPAAPVAEDKASCTGDPVPDLTATGSNIQWYDDAALTNLVHSGSTFATGETAVGTYTWYVTSTANSCEGASSTVTLTISNNPAAPTASDTAVCFGNTVPDLTATGTNIQWYDDAGLTNLVHSGSPFTTGETAVGAYTYYVTDSLPGCSEGAAKAVTLTINNIPSAPAVSDVTVCEGEIIPDLTTTGDSIRWYDDGALTNLVHSGTTFATGKTAVGAYTYYATSTDVTTGCGSPADTVILTINAVPAVPVTADQTVCADAPIPDLTATGTNVKWYDDAALTNLVHTGSPFATGETNTGTYTYYVTDSVSGCTSVADTVTLTINAVPSVPVAPDQSVCEGGAIPDLTASGTNVKWYDDAALTNLVHTGSPFATGNTTAGIYSYYVTDTENGCTSPADSVALNIETPSSAPTGATVSSSATCPGETVTLTVNGGTLGTGATWEWYSGSCGGTAVGSGASVSISPSTTTTYYVRAEGACNLTTCASVTVNVTNTESTAPTTATVDKDTTCSGETVTLGLTGGSLGTGANWEWYSASCGGTAIGSGASVSVSPTVTTTYYVRGEGTCNTTTCESITVYVTNISSVAADSIQAGKTVTCKGESVTLTLSGGSLGTDANWHWYTGGCGTTVASTGTSINVSPIATTTYYARAEGACNTTSCVSVTINVTNTESVAPAAATASKNDICEGGQVTLSVSGGLLGTGAEWKWYSGSCGGTLLGTGASITDAPAGNITYFVRAEGACNITTCESVAVNVQPAPPAPATTDARSCEGSAVPDLAASGSNIKWYDDAALTNQVDTGATFSTGQTLVGSYTYYTTQTSAIGCESKADTVILNIDPVPGKPSVNSQQACDGATVPDLTASGTNLKWYEDVAHANQVGTGASFSTGETAVGTYTYYVTDSLPGCVGDSSEVTLTIHPIPARPTGINKKACFGRIIPDIEASGSSITWYDDVSLGNQVGTGGTYTTGETAMGTYSYFATQTVNGCESPGREVKLEIIATPPKPVAYSRGICEGETVPDLTSTGSVVKWYDDAALTNQVNQGNVFVTGKTAVGEYIYYLTDSLPGCISDPAIVSLSINTIPGAPVLSTDVDTVCYGETVADITASGTGITWYSEPALVIVADTGKAFTVPTNEVGTNKYYATQNNKGCEGPASELQITVNPSPLVTVNKPTAFIDKGDSVKLEAYNASNYVWTPGTGLSATSGAMVWASPDETTVYTVTATNAAGCSNSAKSKVVVDGVIGLNPIDEEYYHLSIYPNPTKGYITIDLATGATEHPVQLNVYDSYGKLILNRTMGEDADGYRERFDLNGLSNGTAGIYHIRVVSEDRVLNRRVVFIR